MQIEENLDEKIKNWKTIKYFLIAKLFNQQTTTKSLKVGKEHYDIGNELYQLMLDPYMCYSCGYWKSADNLNQAQIDKLERSCQKFKLKPGMKVLDIGCGWGSFAKYAAENYRAKVVGVTISKKQVCLGKELCKGLPVDLRFQDYREVDGKFDRVVSLGMFEHVGPKNYKTYMKTVKRNLKDNGLFLLHTIGGNSSVTKTDDWIEKYIFPNSVLPSLKQINKAAEGLFVVEGVHSFGAYYGTTLMEWYKNFDKSWDDIKSNYDEKFYRMWKYYLLASAGSFRARKNQLWQVVLSKKGVSGGYNSIR